ncbi:hypothetical protein ACVR1E_10180 [Streptococcus acidominimus]
MRKMWYNAKVALTILRKWEVRFSMRMFFMLVLLPLVIEILANVISEWLIRQADKRDKKKQ